MLCIGFDYTVGSMACVVENHILMVYGCLPEPCYTIEIASSSLPATDTYVVYDMISTFNKIWNFYLYIQV